MKTSLWPSLLALALGLSGCLDFEAAIARYDCSDVNNCRPPTGDGDGRALTLVGDPGALTVGSGTMQDAWIELAASDGTRLQGVEVRFEILGGGSATGARMIDGSVGITDGGGRIHLPPLNPGTVAGTFTLRATSTGLTPVDVVFTVNPGEASNLEVKVTATSILLHDAYVIESIVVRDVYLNPLPNPTVSLSFPTSGASFNCDGPGSNPLVTTVADLGLPKSCWTNDLVGDPTLVVSSGAAVTRVELHQSVGPADHFRATWPRTFNFLPDTLSSYSFQLEDVMGNLVGPTDETFTATAPGSGSTCRTLTPPSFSGGYVTFDCTMSSTVGPFELSVTLTRGDHTSTLVVPVGIIASGYGGGVSLDASDCISPHCTARGVGSVLAPVFVRVTSGSSTPVPGARLSLEIVPSGVAHFDEAGYSEYVEFAGSRAVTTTDGGGTARTPSIVIDRNEAFRIEVVSVIEGTANVVPLSFDPALATTSGTTTP